MREPFFIRYVMKKFLTYDEQIKKLEDKGLIISDKDKAISILEDLSYYSLISGYKTVFKHDCSGNYLYNITFDDIVSFYNFDNELRLLFLKYIISIEHKIKSILSYEFCSYFGESQVAYTTKENYTAFTNKDNEELEKLINIFLDILSKNTYPFIKYNKQKYNNVPIWILMHTLTLGNVSKFYLFQQEDIKVTIAKKFNIIPKELDNFLKIMTNYRNVCAHGERLYCYKTKENFCDTSIHNQLGIQKVKESYKYGKNDLFSVVIIFKYLLKQEEFLKFCSSLKQILSCGEEAMKNVKNKNLLNLMGFPSNWTKLIEI